MPEGRVPFELRHRQGIATLPRQTEVNVRIGFQSFEGRAVFCQQRTVVSALNFPKADTRRAAHIADGSSDLGVGLEELLQRFREFGERRLLRV